jgi:glutamine cyclotransferase
MDGGDVGGTPPTPSSDGDGTETPRYSYEIVNIFPHDPAAWTQGLVYADGFLYEGTGLSETSFPPGRSSLRKVELQTGKVVQEHRLSPELFGEGIALYQGLIFQLTWLNKIGFVYARESFEEQRGLVYPTEGWGLTHDGDRLIMSDGTPTLFFRDPDTFEETGRLAVHHTDHIPLPRINELEFVKGEILANIWQTDLIARISPETGEVVGWIDLRGLLTAQEAARVDVLNGIAYDAARDRLFVTGKLWPWLFEINLTQVP